MKATELKNKFAASMETLIDAIESDQITDEVNAFWHVMSRFYHYSFRNQCLIMAQNPKATKVAGYKTWQTMGRQVQAKEKGIRIFKPILYKVKDSEYPDSDPRSKGMAFGVTAVFDISQTDGDDLPDITGVDGSEHAAILDRMTEYATDNGIDVSYDDTGAAKGYAQADQKIIKLSDKIDKNEAVGVLAHELAHVLIDQSGKPTEIKEYEADLSAYLFCDRFGIDHKAAHYLKSWDAERKDLESALKAVSEFTGKLINGVA